MGENKRAIRIRKEVLTDDNLWRVWMLPEHIWTPRDRAVGNRIIELVDRDPEFDFFLDRIHKPRDFQRILIAFFWRDSWGDPKEQRRITFGQFAEDVFMRGSVNPYNICRVLQNMTPSRGQTAFYCIHVPPEYRQAQEFGQEAEESNYSG